MTFEIEAEVAMVGLAASNGHLPGKVLERDAASDETLRLLARRGTPGQGSPRSNSSALRRTSQDGFHLTSGETAQGWSPGGMEASPKGSIRASLQTFGRQLIDGVDQRASAR